jgi:hypothetical protein
MTFSFLTLQTDFFYGTEKIGASANRVKDFEAPRQNLSLKSATRSVHVSTSTLSRTNT